jgi:AraC family transcriptional regulator
MNHQLHYRPLFRGPTVTVTDVRCRPGGCECGPEEYSDRTTVVFPRAGAFLRHVRRERILANCNRVLFFRAGETYRVSHPFPGGDDCTSLAFDGEILADAVSRFDPSARDRADSPVGVAHGPTQPAVSIFLHRLRQRFRAGDADGLEVEELAVYLLDAVLDGAYRFRGKAPVREKHSTARTRRERVEAAVGHVTAHFRTRLTLAEIARAVHYSPYHLARLFRREVGEPIHRYLARLRLGVALERLADGADDLTALGLDLGFSSHSHFSTAFRHAFGISPSAFRREPTPARLTELSKNLKAPPGRRG